MIVVNVFLICLCGISWESIIICGVGVCGLDNVGDGVLLRLLCIIVICLLFILRVIRFCVDGSDIVMYWLCWCSCGDNIDLIY